MSSNQFDFRSFAKIYLYLSSVFGAAGAGLWALNESVTIVRTPEGYVEFTGSDGAQSRADGAGIHLSNPFTTSAKKWEAATETLTFTSAPQELDALTVEIGVSYSALSQFEGGGIPARQFRENGDRSLRATFRANNWRAYEEVDPVLNPANAAKLCAQLAADMPVKVDAAHARDVKVTGCKITTVKSGYKAAG
jgi:hypothetical protein